MATVTTQLAGAFVTQTGLSHGLGGAGAPPPSPLTAGFTIALVISLLLVAFTVTVVVIVGLSNGHENDDGPDEGGPGGGGPKPPDLGPSDPDPVWWPEFERGFAAHCDREAAVRRRRDRAGA